MSLMSRAFYHEVLSPVLIARTADIPVTGLASQVVSCKYARLPAFNSAVLHGKNITCQLALEAYLVDSLKASLLIGINNMAPKDIVLSFGRRVGH